MGEVTADEFGGWLPPAKALELVPVGSSPEVKQRWIVRRLINGDIKAAAARSKIVDRHGVRRATFAAIPPHVWQYPWHGIDIDFWETGDAELSNGDQSADLFPTDDPPDLFKVSDFAKFFDVRFDPEGFPATTVNVVDDAQPVPAIPSDRPPLSDAFLTRWGSVFAEANPMTTEAEARRAVEASFPLHHVSRDRLRRIMPPRRRGRPLKSND